MREEKGLWGFIGVWGVSSDSYKGMGWSVHNRWIEEDEGPGLKGWGGNDVVWAMGGSGPN